MSSNPAFLILLGNDIMQDNRCFSFMGIDRRGSEGIIKFKDLERDILVECPAKIGKSPTGGGVNFVSNNTASFELSACALVPSAGCKTHYFSKMADPEGGRCLCCG